MHSLQLTFDTEDCISENSIPILFWILQRLKEYDLPGLFFITGHMAEKMRNVPIVIDLIKEHSIGYHSSSHSVHPTIFEFTDVKDYEEAYQISLKRETSHINPLTGEMEGRGGIYALKDIFPGKPIIAFRAPGHCWSPPHLEALGALGIQYDFSARLTSFICNFKGFTFYPYPTLGYWNGSAWHYYLLMTSLIRFSNVVMTIHPSLIVNKDEWDAQYHNSNPWPLAEPHSRSTEEAKLLMNKFDLLLKQISTLRRMNLIDVTNELEVSNDELKPTPLDVEKFYFASSRWAKSHNYQPSYLRDHFRRFFEIK